MMSTNPLDQDLLPERPRRALGYYKMEEQAYHTSVPTGGFLVLRMDGKAFSTLTRDMETPFDATFTEAMNAATQALCESDVPVVFAYTQSDEISVVLDQRELKAASWYDNQVQKMVSITASIATAHFNAHVGNAHVGYFDSRIALAGASAEEVEDYLAWRKRDAMKNSISMLAHHHFGTQALNRVDNLGRLQLLEQAGVSWEDIMVEWQAGSIFYLKVFKEMVSYVQRGEVKQTEAQRRRWVREPMMGFPVAQWETRMNTRKN